MSRGSVRRRRWIHEGRKLEAWVFSITLDGKRVRQGGFLSRAEAQQALDLVRHPAPVVAAPRVSLTVAEALDRYLQVKSKKKSLIGDRRIAEHLKAELGADTPLSEITGGKIAEYRARRLAQPIGPAAVNRPLQLLRHLLRLAATEWEVIGKDVPRVRLEREPQGRLRWLTPEEATRLLDACRPDVADLVTVAVYTGLRQGELLNLTWADVDRSRGVLLLETTKSGRRREVPLCEAADAVLARMAGTEGLVFGSRRWSTFRKGWEAAVVAAKVGDLRFHDLRHTFASWTVQRGGTLQEVKDLLGHSSLAMVLRYAHLSPERLRSAVARLDTVMAGTRRAQEPVVDSEGFVSSTRAVSSVGRAADS